MKQSSRGVSEKLTGEGFEEWNHPRRAKAGIVGAAIVGSVLASLLRTVTDTAVWIEGVTFGVCTGLAVGISVLLMATLD